jgi:hypothetical protein
VLQFEHLRPVRRVAGWRATKNVKHKIKKLQRLNESLKINNGFEKFKQLSFKFIFDRYLFKAYRSFKFCHEYFQFGTKKYFLSSLCNERFETYRASRLFLFSCLSRCWIEHLGGFVTKITRSSHCKNDGFNEISQLRFSKSFKTTFEQKQKITTIDLKRAGGLDSNFHAIIKNIFQSQKNM